MRQPWERREGESLQAYEAFTIYLTLGPDRNMRECARRLNKALTTLARWGTRHEWQLRIGAYEEHFALRVVNDLEDQRVELMREHAGFAALLLRKSRATLEALADKVELDPEATQQGIVATVDQALRAGDLAVKVGRLATGLDGKYAPSSNAGTDLAGLESEELELLESLLEKAKR